MSIRILLADDHKIMREGLRVLLEKQSGMEVIAEAGDGLAAVKLVQELLPNVVVMDIAMPDMNGLEATRRIIEGVPAVKVIALSMHSDKRFVAEMLKAGASGYMLKDCAFEELAKAIRAVVANRTYLSPELAESAIQDYAPAFSKKDLAVFPILTPGEREALLAEDKTTKEISSSLE